MAAHPNDEQDRMDMVRLADGHDAALNDLMTRHAQAVFRYLLRLLQNESEAEELAQESFVRVYQNRTRFKAGERFAAWLYAIATNLARDRVRWRTRHPQVPLEGDGAEGGGGLKETLAAPNPTPGESLEQSEQAVAVRQAVASLPEELRVPLVLAEYGERSYAEIAAVLDCSPKAAEMRIYRARKELRSRLSRWLKEL